MKNLIENKLGITDFDLIIKISATLTAKANHVNTHISELKSFIVKKIGRNMTGEELNKLSVAIIKYSNSTPNSKDRNEILEYLFTLNFMND